jgi:DNA repair exonuclease SbcCD ATPase subunit
MLDFNDFQPIEESSNPNPNSDLNANPLPPSSENTKFDMDQMNNMFDNLNSINKNENTTIDLEEQKRIADRQKEAEERKEKINKKIREEEEKRIEIRNKAAEYLAEFEAKRKEEIAKKRKALEENENKMNTNDKSGGDDSWSKVKDNIDLKDSEYKGSKDVQRMREAMMNNPNSQPLQNFFG